MTVVFLLIGSSTLLAGESPAAADVTAVTGSAFGYYTDVSLFGGPSTQRGPEPTVTMATDASGSPQQASVASAQSVYGPAVLFRSGQVDVAVEGALGAGGSVTSSTSVQGDPDPAQRPGPFLFDAVDSTCTADQAGVTAATTITGGVVETRYDPVTQLAVETQAVPTSPEPGYAVEGTIDHVGDRFRLVFNEQVANPDGSVTVNAAHMYLLGDIAVGDLVIGQSVCGVTASPADTTTAEPTPTATPEPTPTPTRTPTATATPEELATSPTSGLGGWWPVAGVAALVAAGLAVALVLRRRAGAAGQE